MCLDFEKQEVPRQRQGRKRAGHSLNGHCSVALGVILAWIEWRIRGFSGKLSEKHNDCE